MDVYIKTYGCTLNQADSDIIRTVLEKDNANIVKSERDADVVIVNTCTVKKATSQKILDKLKALEKTDSKVIVTGCMAGANQGLIEKYAPKASIVTMPNITGINDAVASAGAGQRIILNKYRKMDRLALLEPKGSTIARIPINDGCLSSCKFCETKFARGTLNSFQEDHILNGIAYSARMGAKEIQLTSQDTGAYGIDRGTNIAELMERINALDGDFKVRVGMLNPEHLHKYFDRFASALKSDRFYSFVHIPVQSGSNRVLSDMGRNYTIEKFDSYAAELRRKIPGITIETDIIVGFPTETEAEFEETIKFVKRTKPDVTNISRFSARPHAAASRMTQHKDETINDRSRRLSRVVRAVQHGLNDRFIGKKLNVIITETNDKSFNGRNMSYKQVVVLRKDNRDMDMGSRHNVFINAASANVLYA